MLLEFLLLLIPANLIWQRVVEMKVKIFYLLQSSHLPRSSVQGAVEAAIAAGYRHIDTAYSYSNEVDIGKALCSKMQQGIIRRQDMFIVSKVGAGESRCYCGAGRNSKRGNYILFV